MPLDFSSAWISSVSSFSARSREGARSATRRTISSYFFGYKIAKARSSSSHFTDAMPNRCASGAMTSSVSRAFFACFSGGKKRIVRMLCRRSPTLITRTRGSFAIATIILRMVSASAAWPISTLSSLVTPSTSRATSRPKSLVSSSSEYSVSSTVSCNRAATTVVVSMPISAQIVATASGWVM